MDVARYWRSSWFLNCAVDLGFLDASAPSVHDHLIHTHLRVSSQNLVSVIMSSRPKAYHKIPILWWVYVGILLKWTTIPIISMPLDQAGTHRHLHDAAPLVCRSTSPLCVAWSWTLQMGFHQWRYPTTRMLFPLNLIIFGCFGGPATILGNLQMGFDTTSAMFGRLSKPRSAAAT